VNGAMGGRGKGGKRKKRWVKVPKKFRVSATERKQEGGGTRRKRPSGGGGSSMCAGGGEVGWGGGNVVIRSEVQALTARKGGRRRMGDYKKGGGRTRGGVIVSGLEIRRKINNTPDRGGKEDLKEREKQNMPKKTLKNRSNQNSAFPNLGGPH